MSSADRAAAVRHLRDTLANAPRTPRLYVGGVFRGTDEADILDALTATLSLATLDARALTLRQHSVVTWEEDGTLVTIACA